MEGRITLNVGGTRFTTYISTLRSIPGSTLAILMDKPLPADGDDELFIDRDERLFRFILRCHRNAKVYTHQQVGVSKEIWETELAYFGLFLPSDVDTEKRKPKRTSIKDVVHAIEMEKKQKVELMRTRIEALFAWMLAQRPVVKFAFASHLPGLTQPDGVPQEVFDATPAFLRENETEIRRIAVDNRLHYSGSTDVHRYYGQFDCTPASLLYPVRTNEPVSVMYVTLTTFSD